MTLLHTAVIFIGLGCLVQGMVVSDFSKCPGFFVEKTPPTFDNQYIPDKSRQNDFVRICQTQDPDHPNFEYATLYDIKNKIPVYSAYRYYTRAPGTDITRDTAWKIEPMLDGGKLPNMEQQRKSAIPLKNRVWHQALNRDYAHSTYDKGHLFPVNHAENQQAADGTFTLTNAAPQNCDFNKKWYNKVESVVSKELDKHCSRAMAYIVTGVVPSKDKFIQKNNLNVVNVPSHFWTAFCCVDEKSKKVIFYGNFIMGEKDDEPLHNTIKTTDTVLNIKPFGGYCSTELQLYV